MGDLFFFVKILVMTVVLVFLMQIRIGQQTIEERTMAWVSHSPVAQPVQEVAEGGVVLIREVWKNITSGMSTKFTKSLNRDSIPGSRSLGVQLDRSKAYLEEKARIAAEKLNEELNNNQPDEPAYDDSAQDRE